MPTQQSATLCYKKVAKVAIPTQYAVANVGRDTKRELDYGDIKKYASPLTHPTKMSL